ncbi:MAG: Re/Si-specific NAD(P)(+) transhydrogenase subunit alpha [Candidatus Moranbacteria bacterium]|nr:Re/Si-specific NAD(P)(+) transhydrogenase subunit alpha [Candidatus Moranbacteria bacterium]
MKNEENENLKQIIFIPKEIQEDENRVSLTPLSVKKVVEKGFKVWVQEGAGKSAMIGDEQYAAAGAKIISEPVKGYQTADVVISVNPPDNLVNDLKQYEILKKGCVWISPFTVNDNLDLIEDLKQKGISLFSLNLIPRITRAQSMDVLSSQSNLAGYKAVIMASEYLRKIFPLMMTAAGTVNPAKVVVLGVGVAGLQAIATAKRLGAQVEASDIRLSTKEQVESLGAKFIQVQGAEDLEDEKGYAKEASKEFLAKQAAEVAKRVAKADVVITTALVPGKKAPILVTEEMVDAMPKGSVIVDMASQMGGNCELTLPGEIVEKYGVKIIGEKNLPSKLSVNASQLFGENIWAFLGEITKESGIQIDKENEIVRECLVTHQGEIVSESVKKIFLH